MPVHRKKVSKKSVDFRLAKDEISAHRCGNCGMHQQHKQACDLVSTRGEPAPGKIPPEYLCDEWIPNERLGTGK